MKNTKARFVSADHVMSVTMRQGKKGINVAATVRAPGRKALTGSRSTHETEAAATEAYDALRNDAVAKGWTAKTKQARSANAFAEIPTAADVATLTASAPAKKAKAAKEEKAPKGKGK